MVIDTQATPAMAQDVIRRIREVTDKPTQVKAGVEGTRAFVTRLFAAVQQGAAAGC